MIEVTCEYVKMTYPDIKKVGLLSTEGKINAKIYDQALEKFDIEVIKPNVENQKHILNLIKNVKQGVRHENLNGVYNAMNYIKDQGAEIFISGCTEISVALELYNLKGSFIDPLDILTVSIIEFP